jgi:hypothetical protein
MKVVLKATLIVLSCMFSLSSCVLTLGPATPTGLSISPSIANFSVQWNAVPGADTYNYYCTIDGTTPTKNNYHVTGNISGTSMTFTPVAANLGVTYKFVVSAVDSWGEGSLSSVVTSATLVPQNVTFLSDDVSWSAVSGASTYNIYWTYDGTTPTPPNNGDNFNNSWVNDSNLDHSIYPAGHPGNTYQFIVTAVDANGNESGPSAIVSGVGVGQ